MDDWNIESWNDFEDTDQPAGQPDELDEIVLVHICEDMVCRDCYSDRIIRNWRYPNRFCCIDCGLIFSM